MNTDYLFTNPRRTDFMFTKTRTNRLHLFRKGRINTNYMFTKPGMNTDYVPKTAARINKDYIYINKS